MSQVFWAGSGGGAGTGTAWPSLEHWTQAQSLEVLQVPTIIQIINQLGSLHMTNTYTYYQIITYLF